MLQFADVEHLAIKLVRECVEVRSRAVGKIIVSGATDKTCPALKLIAHSFYDLCVFSKGGCCGPDWKCDVREAAGFEHSLLLRAEAIDFQLDQPREFARNAEL